MNIDLILLITISILLVGLVSYGFYEWQRSRNEASLRIKQSQSHEQALSPTQHAADPEQTEAMWVELVLGDAADPWGEIVRYERSAADQYEELQLPETTRIQLSSWFQHAPSLAMNSAQLMANTYTLTFKPEIAKGIADGSLKIMGSNQGGFRAKAVDVGRKMRGEGTLNPTTKLRFAASVTMTWQVLAVITAQQFLSDINKQLVELNKGIADIKDFLEHQQYAALVGNLQYLNTIQETLNRGQLENSEVTTFLNQIEQIDRESGQMMIALQSQMEQILADFKEQPLSAKFSAQAYAQEAKELVAVYEYHAHHYLVAVSVKGLAAQTRCALPASRKLALERLQALEANLDTWTNHRHQFYQTVERRLPELQTWFGDYQTIREQLKTAAQTSQDKLNEAGEQVRALIAHTGQTLKTQLAAENQPLSLLVELNDQGQITKTWKLLKDEASQR